MKKLLLLPLIAIGLALVPVKQADAQVFNRGRTRRNRIPRIRLLRLSGLLPILPTQLLRLLWGLSILPHLLLHGAHVLPRASSPSTPSLLLPLLS